jgi:hypothetical protein
LPFNFFVSSQSDSAFPCLKNTLNTILNIHFGQSSYDVTALGSWAGVNNICIRMSMSVLGLPAPKKLSDQIWPMVVSKKAKFSKMKKAKYFF